MKKYSIGFTAGVFDLFHIGHLNLLKKCKEQCEYLIVGVMTDDFTEHQKGNKPYISCEERMEIVKSIIYVDEVVRVDYHNTYKPDAWKLYHFDVCFTGDDHKLEAGFLQEQKVLRTLGAEMIFLPYTKSISSTQIKRKMADRYENISNNNKL